MVGDITIIADVRTIYTEVKTNKKKNSKDKTFDTYFVDVRN